MNETTGTETTDAPEFIWTGMALMNPRNVVTRNYRTAVITDQDEAIQRAIATDLRERLARDIKIAAGDLVIEGHVDDCAGFSPGTPRWYVWSRIQNTHSPSRGWRECFEIEARPDVGLLWVHRIHIAPDRASDAPENPFLNDARA